MIHVVGYGAAHSFSRLKRMTFERPDAGPGEVEIDVLYCGVCHSDIHQAKNEWHNTVYPCVPGHEIVGRVRRAGANVTRFVEGDLVGVGCMIDSCGSCDACRAGDQNYCEGPNSWLATYNGPMVPAAEAPTGTNMYGRDNTYGGYSTVLVVKEQFVLRIPDGMDPRVAGPILCAGVTTYSPLVHWGVQPGQRVGVIGLGGLGHMAVQIARAMGAQVTVFTTSKEKHADASRFGASVVPFGEVAERADLKGSFDLILSTVPEKHDVNPFMPLLKRDRTLVIVGALEPMAAVDNSQVAFHRQRVAGSLIGNLAETQAVLDFCAQHGIAPEVEVIPMQEINRAFSRVEKGEVRYRYVIDMASLTSGQE